jgi:hypothetical protein
VVIKVVSDWKVSYDWNSKSLKVSSRANTRQLKDLRSTEGASRENHFLCGIVRVSSTRTEVDDLNSICDLLRVDKDLRDSVEGEELNVGVVLCK